MTKRRFDKRAFKTVLRLLLTFGGYLLIFVIAFQIDAVHETVVQPFTSLVAGASTLLMNLFGAGAHNNGCVISTSEYSINVVDGCNGIYATVILIAGILAYPRRWSYKAWGIVLGVVAIFVVNLGRVISLFYLGEYYPDLFDEVHVYAWQPLIIVWAIFIWDFWARKTEEAAIAE
jgi:exosortase H (IPTLxxWG-CTERM-specific)